MHDKLDTVTEVRQGEDCATTVDAAASDYDTKVSEIRARLASLPSAYTPDVAVSQDWVYEACRIAAIIYASAIIMRVPFSVAAEPGRSIIMSDAAFLTNFLAADRLLSTRLTEALYEVLERSNTSTIWGDMSGVLYWVCCVGAAAARTPTSINISQTPRSRSEAYATWVRRCLIMYGTRVLIILIFQHPLPILQAQKRLLKVQALIGRGHSGRLS
jgi:hypothetical protein